MNEEIVVTLQELASLATEWSKLHLEREHQWLDAANLFATNAQPEPTVMIEPAIRYSKALKLLKLRENELTARLSRLITECFERQT